MDWIKSIERNARQEQMEGSTSELIMCALALDRWSEAPEGWRNAPWKAWSFRLNDSQREAVQAWHDREE